MSERTSVDWEMLVFMVMRHDELLRVILRILSKGTTADEVDMLIRDVMISRRSQTARLSLRRLVVSDSSDPLNGINARKGELTISSQVLIDNHAFPRSALSSVVGFSGCHAYLAFDTYLITEPVNHPLLTISHLSLALMSQNRRAAPLLRKLRYR